MCNQPSSSATPGRHRRALNEDLAVLDPQVRGQQRPPGRPQPRSGVGGRQGRHLRRRLGEPVGLDHRGAAAERLGEHLLRHRPAADQHRPQRQQVDVGLEQADELRGDHRDQGHAVALERLGDPVDVEAVVDHRRGPVDDAAHDDREPADVKQRQAAEPAVGGLDAEVERRADGAPEVVAVGEADRARAAGGAAREDPAVQGVEVVLAEERQVGLGQAEVGRAVDGQRRLGAIELEPRARRSRSRVLTG